MATATTEKFNHTRRTRMGESNRPMPTTPSRRRSGFENHEGEWHDKHSISESKSVSKSSLHNLPNFHARPNSTRARSVSVGKFESRKDTNNLMRADVDAKKSATTDEVLKPDRLSSRSKSNPRFSVEDLKPNGYRKSIKTNGLDKELLKAEKKTNDLNKQTLKIDTTSKNVNELVASCKTSDGGWVDSIMMDSSECVSPNAIFFSKADMSPKFSKFTPLDTIYSKDKSSSDKSFRNTSSSVAIHSSSMSVRVKPSARISVREFSKASIEKEKDPYRKCKTNVWLSCIGGGACMPANGAPILKKDRPLDFDNLPSKEREIRVSWADKHRPGSLAGFVCHKQQAQFLKQLISHGNCPHILFQGPPGSGKKALTMALLRDIYGGSSWRISHELRSFDLQGKRHGTISLPVASSPHHMELNISPVAENSRYVLMALIKELARTSEIAVLEEYESSFVADYKVMVLYEVERLSKDVQHIIKWMMDRYTDAVKLVLCSDNDASLIDGLKNRCQVIKVDAPLTHEIMEVLLQIAKKERFDLPMSFAARIASKSKQNLRRAIMSLEACKAYQYPFQEDQPIPVGWDELVSEIATDVLMDPTSKRVFIVRGKFQRLLSDCVNPRLILQSLMEELMRRIPTSIKRELYYSYVYSDKHLSKGNVLIKLEEFVAKVISIYANYLKENSSMAM
ncbi:hypothetical protein SUGI_0373920 [Cryptomeria japonica]|nr:hypothetical protein SUGI_0373920 [Cryptomeria japonica]